MRKIITILILFTSMLFAQQATLEIDENFKIEGDSLTVGLIAKNFDEVASLTIRIKYDSEIINWGRMTNVSSDFSSMISGTDGKEVSFAWYSLNAVSIDSAKILDLKFHYSEGITDLVFNEASSQITNSTEPLNATYINGSIGISGTPDKAQLISPQNENVVGYSNVQLTWNSISNADNYELEISSDNSFSNVIINESSLADTSYTIGNIVDGSKLYWRVRGTNQSGSGSFSDVGAFISKLIAPSNLTATSEVIGEVELNWSDNTGNETNYEIYRKENSESDFTLIAAVSEDESVFTDASVKDTTEYTYKVKAVNDLVESDFSSEAVVTTITDVEIIDGLPKSYSLKQNYPNPFNPTTTIEFAIPNSGEVNLTVYDLLGNKVEKLISDNLSAGNYKVTFDAKTLPSGIYFYRLESNNFVQSKKMILVK